MAGAANSVTFAPRDEYTSTPRTTPDVVASSKTIMSVEEANGFGKLWMEIVDGPNASSPTPAPAGVNVFDCDSTFPKQSRIWNRTVPALVVSFTDAVSVKTWAVSHVPVENCGDGLVTEKFVESSTT